jgi:hypothetical protein
MTKERSSMNDESKELFIEELDKARRTLRNAEEDYKHCLEEYEEQYGLTARETYEEQHI